MSSKKFIVTINTQEKLYHSGEVLEKTITSGYDLYKHAKERGFLLCKERNITLVVVPFHAISKIEEDMFKHS